MKSTSTVQPDNSGASDLALMVEAVDPVPRLDFERLLRLAARIVDMPMAAITVTEDDIQIAPYAVGMEGVEPGVYICSHTIKDDSLVIIPDAAMDPRFSKMKVVTGPPHVRFYAGSPLISPKGQRLGTLAFMDRVPRVLSSEQKEDIKTFANQVMVHLELQHQREELRELAQHLQQAQRIASIGSWEHWINEDHLQLSDELYRLFGIAKTGFDGRLASFLELVHAEDKGRVMEAYQQAVQGKGVVAVECRIVKPDAKVGHFQIIGELFLDKNGKPFLAGTTQEITRRKQDEAQIERLAFFDQLTRLPNRGFLLNRIEHVLAIRQRGDNNGAVLFIDLDNFKALNDSHGHAKGDELLQHVGRRLQTCVRHCDTVARFGGDEFVVLLEELGAIVVDAASHANHVAEKIIQEMNAPFVLQGLTYRITSSIGVALIHGENIDSGELLKRADMAMYQAKNEGRNTMRFYSPQLQREVNRRVLLEAEIRQAVADQAFELYYQPQVDKEERIIGVEALIRWNHPARGVILPREFIPISEELGLIMEIGRWTLEQGCRQLVEWSRRPSTMNLTLSVNISTRHFHHANFVEQVVKVLESTGADPNNLKIEITESLLIKDIEDAVSKMLALKAKGINFSLDDFGTGYSSLGYLKKLPLDQLKIDQSFVRDVLTDESDAVIAKAIVALGRSLGLSVIAEGVETEGQRDFLADNDCHDYQGYFYQKPLPLSSFSEFVESRA